MRRKSGLQIEVTLRDENWKKLETLKCNSKEFPRIIGFLFTKYGIRAIKKKDKDLNWLGKADW